MNKLKQLGKFALENFGPVLIFYGTNELAGLKPAILTSTFYTLFEVINKMRKKEKLTGIFKYTAAMTLIFGAVDLYSQHSFLYNYESTVTNVFTGLFFGASLFSSKTVIQEYRERAKGERPVTRDLAAYFKILTAVWVAYFFLKAAGYYWVATHLSLEQGLAVRTVLGSGSLYLLLFISIVGSKRIFPWMKKMKFLPPAEPVAA